jgi:hypothetical protein
VRKLGVEPGALMVGHIGGGDGVGERHVVKSLRSCRRYVVLGGEVPYASDGRSETGLVALYS